MIEIVWFKRDLRVADHAPLVAAAEAGRVLPLYVAEPEGWAQPTHSARQWAHIAEALADLAADLAGLGAPLRVEIGDAVDVLDALRRRHGAVRLWSHEETGDAWSYARDRRVAAWARARGVAWRESPAAGVVRRLATRDGWAQAWERTMRAPVLAPPALRAAEPDPLVCRIPDIAALGLAPDPCAARQRGGRRAALATLESFLAERGRTYRRAMATPALAFDACSRLSPHLAVGALSSREAAQAARLRLEALRAQAAPGAGRDWTSALESFLSRLHWRCHFMQKLEDEPAIEYRPMHRAYEGLHAGEPDPGRLAAWEAGQTGLPFVDACMRALTATGYMNFRMRAMLTAVASYHLWLDWRRTGPVLARRFADFEPGIHWSQMQMQSGVTGVNTMRVYNPVKQGLEQDPTGAFTRTWVPELAQAPLAFLQTPWRMDRATQAAAGVVLGRDYPEPIVEHEAAARAAKARVHAVRQGAAFAQEKAAVMRKHASRKPGRDAGPRRRQISASASGVQLAFDLGDEG